MISNLVEDRKALHKAFLKTKAIRELLESFLAKLTPFSNFSNENESKRFSKKNTQDFLKNSSYDPIYSLNILGRGFGMIQIESSIFRYTDVIIYFFINPCFLNKSRQVNNK